MAKGEAKRTNQLLDQQLAEDKRRYEAALGVINPSLAAAQNRSNQIADTQMAYLTSMLGEESEASPVISALLGGGMSPAERAAIESSLGDLDSLRGDRAAQARLRGGGVYDEFAKTGGVSEAEKAVLRRRIGSSNASFYDALKNELERMNVVQGGYNPGYGSQMDKLARSQSRANTDALSALEADILETVLSGRKWGAEGMTGSEDALQKLLQAGAAGKSSGLLSLSDAINRNRLSGVTASQDRDKLRAALVGQMGDVRTGVPGEASLYTGALLDALGGGSQAASRTLGARAQNNPNVGWWDKAAAIGGAVSGAATPFMVGKKKKEKNTGNVGYA